MKYLNEFISYEFLETEITKCGSEVGVYLVKLQNEGVTEYTLYKSFVLPEDDEKPFSMTDIFVELMSRYTLYVLNEKDFNCYMANNTLNGCDDEHLCMLWEKCEMSFNKLTHLFGKNLIYFIKKYVVKEALFGLPEYFECVSINDIKEMLVIDLIGLEEDCHEK